MLNALKNWSNDTLVSKNDGYTGVDHNYVYQHQNQLQIGSGHLYWEQEKLFDEISWRQKSCDTVQYCIFKSIYSLVCTTYIL